FIKYQKHLVIRKNINLGGGANKDSLLLQTNVPLEYPTELNKPQRIVLPRNVLVSGKFFIGVEQLTDKALTLGFDKNNDNSSKIYYNIFNKWEQNTLPNVKGSIVMRPVFRKPAITGFEDNVVELDVNLYPNPTQNEVHIEGEVQKVIVMDCLGREVITQEFDILASDKKLNMSHLPNGMYIVQLLGKDHKKAIRKISKQ
ncbi:MAG: T9SS type A sorting domain-containing protein, partial [Thermoflexibacteraceae bacterium]